MDEAELAERAAKAARAKEKLKKFQASKSKSALNKLVQDNVTNPSTTTTTGSSVIGSDDGTTGDNLSRSGTPVILDQVLLSSEGKDELEFKNEVVNTPREF